jgi:hypothetical protein
MALSDDLAAAWVHPEMVERCRLLEHAEAQSHWLLVSAHAGLTEHLRLVGERRGEGRTVTASDGKPPEVEQTTVHLRGLCVALQDQAAGTELERLAGEISAAARHVCGTLEAVDQVIRLGARPRRG